MHHPQGRHQLGGDLIAQVQPDIQGHRNPPAGCGGQPHLAVDAGPGPEGKMRRQPGIGHRPDGQASGVRPADKRGGSRPVGPLPDHTERLPATLG